MIIIWKSKDFKSTFLSWKKKLIESWVLFHCRMSANCEEDRTAWVRSIQESIRKDPFYDIISAKKAALRRKSLRHVDHDIPLNSVCNSVSESTTSYSTNAAVEWECLKINCEKTPKINTSVFDTKIQFFSLFSCFPEILTSFLYWKKSCFLFKLCNNHGSFLARKFKFLVLK